MKYRLSFKDFDNVSVRDVFKVYESLKTWVDDFLLGDERSEAISKLDEIFNDILKIDAEKRGMKGLGHIDLGDKKSGKGVKDQIGDVIDLINKFLDRFSGKDRINKLVERVNNDLKVVLSIVDEDEK